MLKTIDSFLVIDTEGNPVLTEIALVDSQGKIVYDASVSSRQLLSTVITEVMRHCVNQKLVFHNAEHDRRILLNSCQKVGITWEFGNGECTCEMARSLLPQLSQYSLDYL
ncbi:MAG: hypothetical protein ACKVQA_26295, partial [Burkholderiales bacterium]